MRTRFRTHMALALVLGLMASLALAGGALAAETTLTAALAGTPEGDNPGDPDGSGTASIVVDPAAGTLCWELTAENIEPVTQSHIHVGAEGVSGGIVVPLDTDGFEGTSEGCIEPMEDAQALEDILADPAGFYVNLHTADFPPGAIRGQLSAGQPNTAVSIPSTSPLLLIGVLLLSLGAVTTLRATRSVRWG